MLLQSVLADKAGGVCWRNLTLKMELAGAEPRKQSRGSKGMVAGLQRCNAVTLQRLPRLKCLQTEMLHFNSGKFHRIFPNRRTGGSKGHLGVARACCLNETS